MPRDVDEKRKKEYGDYLNFLRSHLKSIAPITGTGMTLLDAGCGEGYCDLEVAQVFNPKEIILTDLHEYLEVDLPPNARFIQSDICSDGFVDTFRGRVQMVMCITVLHEVANVALAVANLLSVLPWGGAAVIMDRSEEGWEHQKEMMPFHRSIGNTIHLMKDLFRVSPIGLDRDEGIRRFWEEIIFPMVPGETSLVFNGNLYTVIYIARNWGEVKLMPPALEARLRHYHQ